MKIVIPKPAERIRAVILFFSIFVALMLFQTDYMHLGTITAATAIFLTIAAFFFQGGHFRRKLRLPWCGFSLILFLAYSIVRSLFGTGLPSYFLPYASQIILCVFLFSVNLNKREENFIRTVFVTASTIYAILIIKSLYDNQVAGYYHTDIQIFNTAFDPNFIGIPLTAAMALLLDSALRKQKTFRSMIMFMVIAYAIFFTASRGSFVAIVISCGLVFAIYILKEQIPARKKLVYMTLPVIAIVVGLFLVKTFLPVEWERMQNIGIDQSNGRLVLWKTAFTDWMQNPIWGNGLEYAYRAHGKATHNTYLQVLSETGLIGLFFMCGFVIPMIWKARKVNTALFCAIIGVLVQIAFLEALNSRCVWILLSWTAMMPTERRTREDESYEKSSVSRYSEI